MTPSGPHLQDCDSGQGPGALLTPLLGSKPTGTEGIINPAVSGHQQTNREAPDGGDTYPSPLCDSSVVGSAGRMPNRGAWCLRQGPDLQGLRALPPVFPKHGEPHHRRSGALEGTATASPAASPVSPHRGRHVLPRTGLSGPVVCARSQVWGVQSRERAPSCPPVPLPGSERAPFRQT